MSDIYAQHDAAFRQVSAYVVLDANNRKVATVALKFPKDGAGRLYAYVHWLGVPMVRGYAGGYGYDKRSAAVADAVRKIRPFSAVDEAERARAAGKVLAAQAAEMHAIARNEQLERFVNALARDSGEYFDRRLTDAGFTVLQAV